MKELFIHCPTEIKYNAVRKKALEMGYQNITTDFERIGCTKKEITLHLYSNGQINYCPRKYYEGKHIIKAEEFLNSDDFLLEIDNVLEKIKEDKIK